MYFKSVAFMSLLLCACSDKSEKQNNQDHITDSSNLDWQVYIDQEGDTAFDFIDITNIKKAFDDNIIYIQISLMDLPDLLPYNSAGVSDNSREYNWGVSFDIDRDETKLNNIEIEITHFKPSDSSPKQASLLEFTQKSIWQVNESGDAADVIQLSIDASIEKNNLIIRVPKSSVEAIKPDTPFQVEAFYNLDGSQYSDFYPDSDSFQK